MKQSLEQLEFAISQYLDGTLGPVETAALDERFASDPDARALLAEYQQLDAALKKSHRVPDVKWDRLTQQISESLRNEEIPARAPIRLFLARSTANLAIAASVLIAVSMGIAIYLQQNANTIDTHSPALTVVQISGPQIEIAQASAVQEIAIGPALSSDGIDSQWVQTIVPRRSSVTIASSAASAQDSGPF
jgi:anti-sigma factor RsiW